MNPEDAFEVGRLGGEIVGALKAKRAQNDELDNLASAAERIATALETQVKQSAEALETQVEQGAESLRLRKSEHEYYREFNERPSVLFRPQLRLLESKENGRQWEASYGYVAAAGNTPAEAIKAFDLAFTTGITLVPPTKVLTVTLPVDTPSSSEKPNSSGEKVDRSNQCTISGADPDEVQAKKRGKRSE